MDFSITTALMLKVSNIKAGLNSRGGRLTAPCLRKGKVQGIAVLLSTRVRFKYIFTQLTSNLVKAAFYFP